MRQDQLPKGVVDALIAYRKAVQAAQAYDGPQDIRKMRLVVTAMERAHRVAEKLDKAVQTDR